MAAIRSQPATCKDGEMRSAAFHSSLPMKSHDLETARRRCTSAAEIQRLLLPHGCCYLRKREPSSNDSLMTFVMVQISHCCVNFCLTHCQDLTWRT